jgi:hypothetical protein
MIWLVRSKEIRVVRRRRIPMSICSTPIKAKPRKLSIKWSIGSFKADYGESVVVKWMNRYTDFLLITGMLDNGHYEIIETVGFEKLSELAEMFPSLAKKLAKPFEEFCNDRISLSRRSLRA